MKDFNSAFAVYIVELILKKRALGYKYIAQEQTLKKFDNFCLNNFPNEMQLTKEIVDTWGIKTPTESNGTLRGRMTVVKHLAQHMNYYGENAYVCLMYDLPKEIKYPSYIYSDTEIKKLFYEIDNCHYSAIVPNRHFIMPVLFRLLLCCGLRIGEALDLKINDVDLGNGILTIRDSKNNNDRLVPMSLDLTEMCNEYYSNVHKKYINTAFFFPGIDGERIPTMNVYANFRRFMLKAGISHGGRGKGPRIYDLRHTYAVNCLKYLVENDKDMNTYYPILKTYMGHSFFKYTAYYLKLTKTMYPDICAKLEVLFNDLIPEMYGDEYE